MNDTYILFSIVMSSLVINGRFKELDSCQWKADPLLKDDYFGFHCVLWVGESVMISATIPQFRVVRAMVSPTEATIAMAVNDMEMLTVLSRRCK